MGGMGLCASEGIWSSSHKTFDQCFQEVVLSSVPLGLLLLVALPQYVLVVARKTVRPDWSYSRLDRLRLVFSFVVAIIPIIMGLVQHFTTKLGLMTSEAWYSTAVMSVAVLLYLFLNHMEVIRRVPESQYGRLFWGLLFLVQVVGLPYPVTEAYHAHHMSYSNWRVIVAFVLTTLGMIIAVFFNAERAAGTGVYKELGEALLSVEEEDESVKQSPPLPETGAGLLSLWSFSWLNPILATGYRRALTHEDLYALHPKETADVLSVRLERAWAKEKQRAKPSLGRALARAFGPTFVVASIYKFIYDSLLFAGPALLNSLIRYMRGTEPVYEGYQDLGLLVLSALLSSLTLHQYFHRAFRTGMRLKSAIISLVYKKALRIRPGQSKGEAAKSEKSNGSDKDSSRSSSSSSSDKEKEKEKEKAKAKKSSSVNREAKTTGEIVNLMAVDAQRLQDLMSYFATLWSAPFQCALALYFLYEDLQWAIFAGVGVMLISIPISAMVATRIRKIQRELMKIKDERIKLTNEVFGGMKILKLYAWERSFEEKIKKVRNDELRLLRKYALTNIGARFTWTIVPLAVSLASFSLYSLTGHELTAEKAFPAMALFNVLRFPLAMFPQVLSSVAEAVLSIERIRRFLDTPEVAPLPAIGPATRSSGSPVSLRGVELRWDEETVLLRDVTFDAWRRNLTIVIGSTGSGKTGLLLSLIGDIAPTKGDLNVAGSIAYVAQTAWIQNATVRDNILLGKPFEPAFYEKVLEVCCLLDDFKILPAGDMTEIGEKGINLSGGQKQRVALARAVYQQADVYLLDDCLSAVDSQVARHIFEHCILGVLSSKTVILVTHNLYTLPQADQIILLDQQAVAFKGSYREFRATDHPFAKKGAGPTDGAGDDDTVISDGSETLSTEEEMWAEGKSDRSSMSSVGSLALDKTKEKEKIKAAKKEEAAGTAGKKEGGGGTLIEKEAVAVGSVGSKIYKAYVRAAGGLIVFLLAVGFLLAGQGLQIGSNSWLSVWDHKHLSSTTGLTVYATLCGVSAVVIALTLLVFSLAGVRAARVFHEDLLHRLLRAPMSFYDITPLGRILNRFSKDTYTIDETLIQSIYMWLMTFIGVVGTLSVIGAVTPWFLIAAFPPFCIYYFTQRYYVPTSRELKRLDSVSRSPIFSHFSESLEGTSTIRAFRVQAQFIRDNEKKIDYNLQAYYLNIASNRWLAMRLEFVGTCIVALAGLFAVLAKGKINPGAAGLSIMYSLNITQTLNWMVRMTAETETNIVAVERVREYSEVSQEAPAVVEGHRPPDSWPTQGAISIRNLCMAYREGLPLVLRNFNLDINAREKIGIVGRTGAGKSSLLLSLLRLVEAQSGEILVDGINIATIGLEDLRSHFSIIPQDPVLFTGSVRFNLDPFNKYSDDEVWQALRRAHLNALIDRLPAGLESQVEEGGKNFSLGERQLLCLARALLRHSMILLLDEATSAVDAETDRVIQETIREEFKDSTILTIAHRIETIIDYDRVVVLMDGEVREQGAPTTLLEDANSEFTAIYEAYMKGMAT